MAKFYEKTGMMGGANDAFQTTCWVDIRDVKMRDEARRRVIVDNLIKTYWRPVYCHLMGKGYDNEQAKDLTQGFFHEIVLGNDLIAQADQNKGRFRTFLLTALEHYAANVYRKETTQKRSPRGELLRFYDTDMSDDTLIPSTVTPEDLFHYAWASELLDNVLARLKEECYSTEKQVHWQIFRAKVLGPIFENRPAPSLKEICTEYGIESESRVSNMLVTVKRRFQAILTSCLRQFVQSNSEIEAEFNELVKILSKSSAR